MDIEELINELQKIKDKRGNVTVTVLNMHGKIANIEGINDVFAGILIVGEIN